MNDILEQPIPRGFQAFVSPEGCLVVTYKPCGQTSRQLFLFFWLSAVITGLGIFNYQAFFLESEVELSSRVFLALMWIPVGAFLLWGIWQGFATSRFIFWPDRLVMEQSLLGWQDIDKSNWFGPVVARWAEVDYFPWDSNSRRGL